MHHFFRLLSEYFWLACLAIGAFNFVKARNALPRDASGQVNDEAAKYLTRFVVGANVPWLIAGIGQVVGSTPTVWHYFRPQDGNPFVIAWVVTIFLTACFYAWWVFFANGAEKVRELNLMAVLGQHQSKPQSAFLIKLFALLGVLMVPIWVYLVAWQNVPLPKY